MPGSVELFKKYPNRMFIETGSAYGDGIQQALDAGFMNVISIETSQGFYDHCLERFKGDYKVYVSAEMYAGMCREIGRKMGAHYQPAVRVVLVHGDSREELKHVKEIPFQITFWLDGHNEDDYPLIAELDAISEHFIKTHTILIDDLRMLDEKKHGLSVEILKAKLLEINPTYQFCFENGHIGNDILVAHP